MEDRFQIHLITDRRRARIGLEEAVLAALRGGVDWVQLREKGGPAAGLYETALRIAPEARRRGVGVLVNDRVDVALAAGADGVHLAARSLPPAVARSLISGGMLLGVSVHSLQEARRAVEGGADYVTFGHVYPTASKPGLPPRGVRELARIVESVEVPVLAVGGIDASNVREVLSTGASGIAVISAILAAADPEGAARRLRRAVDDLPHRPRRPMPEPRRGGGDADKAQPGERGARRRPAHRAAAARGEEDPG
ncbi:thiamine-phosphate pyrophosphorylase [Rubrobacter xylanophilus DSM 9941]|uniref:Thiamine-phosphate synthase n=1 Tax=Rubrobacter xylanophilus (strain DSM 9941 / JCM 11954 / NBRC 16129 / PRD-1) TaxID=266117 RepID=Q1ATF5_RUBXD|nr:thiamine phosphate synthase [Rubrobacter xylanophilus]ABG05323.1 thiamine-phosphate pyrophosphorylase [Rubrobacter xylanophilus DSM 9941]